MAQAAVDGQEWEKVGKREEVHHRDHRRGNNRVQNLEMVLGRGIRPRV